MVAAVANLTSAEVHKPAKGGRVIVPVERAVFCGAEPHFPVEACWNRLRLRSIGRRRIVRIDNLDVPYSPQHSGTYVLAGSACVRIRASLSPDLDYTIISSCRIDHSPTLLDCAASRFFRIDVLT